MILGKACINENIEKISLKKGTLKPTGLRPEKIEESFGSTAFMTDKVETRKSSLKNEYKEYPCIAAGQRNVSPMSVIGLYVKSNAQAVQLVTSHKILIMNCQALVAQGKVNVVPTKPFVINMANWSSQRTLIPKEMKVATCSEAPATRVDPRDTAPRKKSITPEYSVNATRIDKAPEPKTKFLKGITM